MKKFVTYKCNTCNRTIDKQADLLHGFINLCTITQNCRGRLKPIATKNLREILPSSANGLLQNWRPRTDQVTVANAQTETSGLINIATATPNELTLAIKGVSSILPNQVYLNFFIDASAFQEYIEYTYLLPANQTTIIGTDNSSLRKLLKFSTTDKVIVYVNGVIVPETNYTLNWQGDVGYSITFTTAKNVQVDVEVVVFQNVPAQLTDTALEFHKNSTIETASAWNNVIEVSIDQEIWTLYTCTNITLPANTVLSLYEGGQLAGSGLENISLSSLRFLTAYSPYTAIDRIYTASVNLDELSADGQFIRRYVHVNFDLLQASVSTFDVKSLITVIQLKQPLEEYISTSAVTTLEPTLVPKNETIIGPF